MGNRSSEAGSDSAPNPEIRSGPKNQARNINPELDRKNKRFVQADRVPTPDAQGQPEGQHGEPVRRPE